MKTRFDQLTARQKLFCELYVGPGRHCAALAARLAGYAPASSNVTGCQLLQQPKIATTVRGLEEAMARDMRVSRQGVIAALVDAVDLARSLKEPSAMVSALKNVAQICGYYRQEEVRPASRGEDAAAMDRLQGMSDAELVKIIEAGQPAQSQPRDFGQATG